jgi:hypothetical protein
MESAFEPSRCLFYYLFNFLSNSKKVVRKKDQGKWIYETVHWRTETMKVLYDRCCVTHPVFINEKCSISYFAKFTPWYVRQKPKYSGLCWKHDMGKFYTKLLQTKRIGWHLDCDCDCVYCIDCDHGKKPLDGNCHEGSCKRCKEIECSVEWDNDIPGKYLLFNIDRIEYWIDRSYGSSGPHNKFQKQDTETYDIRLYLMDKLVKYC